MTDPKTVTVQERLQRAWRKICCRFGNHRLFVIARCGIESDHVGCIDCARQWGMHHGVRAFLPWSDVRSFHIEQGYDEAAALTQLNGGRNVG